MKGKGAVGEGTWMLSPENPNCSPEALGTTTGIHSLLLLLTRPVGMSVRSVLSTSASVTITISSSIFYFYSYFYFFS